MATIIGYTDYTTEEGDRWDNIAFKAYGDAQQMPAIIAANRNLGIPESFAAGVKILVPILTENDLTSPDNLPPWKR